MSVDALHSDNISKGRWSCFRSDGVKLRLCSFSDLDARLDEKQPSSKKWGTWKGKKSKNWLNLNLENLLFLKSSVR